MGGADTFFDDFKPLAAAGEDQGDEQLFTDDDFQRLRALFLEGHPADELRRRYRALLAELLGARGRSVEYAKERHGDYPYVAAYDDDAALDTLAAEAAAAGRVKVAEKEEWVPPPPDDEPETAADYE